MRRPSMAAAALLLCSCTDEPTTAPLVRSQIVDESSLVRHVSFDADKSNHHASILFVTDRGGTDQDLSSILPDGSFLSHLTASTGLDISPRWSPDRSQIAFASERWGGPGTELYIANADGTGARQLTSSMYAVYGIAWSPDGKRLAFESSGGSFTPSNLDVYVINVDGTGLVNITNRSGFDGAPDWSPDGRRILFLSDRSSSVGLFLMNYDGSGVTQLPTLGEATGASWSPDGHWIAYGDLAGNSDVWIMRTNGSNKRQLTNDPSNDRAPTWAPNGRVLAFQSDRTGSWQVFSIKSDGSGVQQVTQSPHAAYGPSWR